MRNSKVTHYFLKSCPFLTNFQWIELQSTVVSVEYSSVSNRRVGRGARGARALSEFGGSQKGQSLIYAYQS